MIASLDLEDCATDALDDAGPFVPENERQRNGIVLVAYM
jgi:hypothetical protein